MNFEELDTQQLNVDDISKSIKRFGKADYAVFITMLFCCSMVGLYFGYKDHQQHKKMKKHRRGSEALDYLMGGRNMQVFPVAMSLVASFISGITLLGEFSCWSLNLIMKFNFRNADGNLSLRNSVLLHFHFNHFDSIRYAFCDNSSFPRIANHVHSRGKLVSFIYCLLFQFLVFANTFRSKCSTDRIIDVRTVNSFNDANRMSINLCSHN